MSDMQQTQVQLYHNVTLLLNRQTNAASSDSDTDGDIIISGASTASTLYQRCQVNVSKCNSGALTASTLYQRCQVNVSKCNRNSWKRKQTTVQSQLGDRVRNWRKIEMVSI